MNQRIFNRFRGGSTIAVACLFGALSGVVATRLLAPAQPAMPFFPTVHASTDAGTLQGGFAPIMKRATPAVVNIASSRIVRSAQQGFMLPPGFQEFFGFPGMNTPRERREHSLGSGVIVNAGGYILTNNHVVQNATTITVTLADRRELAAKIVGTDPGTDVAVLKVNATNLPVMPLGDSSKVQVGDLALAIGNPFGIGQTVTMGIIGATGRAGLGIENYEDFIQTDAAINPGNSGGALIDNRGDLIAINTAIIAGNQGGGNQGIGFAVPINMAKEVMEQLIKSGKVVRGYMGIEPQAVSPSLAKAFGLADGTRGVLVNNVMPDAPAAKAGLKAGDVIVALNGEAVNDPNEFKLRVSRNAPGSTVKIGYLRDGKKGDAEVTLARLPNEAGRDNDNAAPEDSADAPAANSANDAGFAIQTVTPDIARQLGNRELKGVIVTGVEDGSVAAEAGLQTYDVIFSVDRKPVASAAEFNRLWKASSNSVLLHLNRRGSTLFLVVQKK